MIKYADKKYVIKLVEIRFNVSEYTYDAIPRNVTHYLICKNGNNKISNTFE